MNLRTVFTGLIVAATLSLWACGCEGPTATHSPDRPAKTSSRPVSLTLAEVREMLKSELTIAQLKQRLGEPASASQPPMGSLVYALPGGKWLTFTFKGLNITGARYDRTDIAGISPKTHQIHVRERTTEGKRAWRVEMDDHEFANVDDFQDYLQSLPKGSLVEYHVGSGAAGADEPLRSHDDIDKLRLMCRSASVILLFYPAD